MSIDRTVQEARALMSQMLFDDALQLWRDVCALGEPTAAHRVAMAICLVELGASDEALFELETALSLDAGARELIDDEHRFSAILDRLR